MKLLFDQNLSYVLVARLADLYPQSAHVRDLGLESADDEAVWNHARQHDFIIVSKDSDFRQRSFLRGAPPKIVWLSIGNCSTNRIEELLRASSTQIFEFAPDLTSSFLELR